MEQLAQQATEMPHPFGWFVGLGIGFVIILVVVVIVATILSLASRISKQAQDAIRVLDESRANTLALWDIDKTNRATKAITEAAKAARGALTG